MYVFYVENRDINDATDHYLRILEAAVERNGDSHVRTDRVQDIGKDDIAVVITYKSYLLAWLHRPGQKIVMWCQGIVPQENLMMFGGWRKYFKFAVNSCIELLMIRTAYKLFFVSRAMQVHYSARWHWHGRNFYVMPCFNLPMEEKYFLPEKYSRPSFVYAGGMQSWQCVDQTLSLFEKIREAVPGSSLSILSADRAQAEELIARHGLEDAVTLSYVPYTEMAAELGRYKYGFLLREDTLVNRVATPTKMNSYLSCGLIPVFSDVIGDFRQALEPLRYKVMADSQESVLRQILEIEGSQIDLQALTEGCHRLFDSYYSDEYHTTAIAEFLK